MIFIHFFIYSRRSIAPNEDNPNVTNSFGATDLTNGKAIWIKEAIPSPN